MIASGRGFRAAPPLVLVVALALAGCAALQRDTIINGWSVGPLMDCSNPRCRDEIPVAEAALEEHFPGHPVLVALEIHQEGQYHGPNGEGILMTRSGGCCEVALFRFADGSVWAIGVGYVGVSDTPQAVLSGPMSNERP